MKTSILVILFLLCSPIFSQIESPNKIHNKHFPAMEMNMHAHENSRLYPNRQKASNPPTNGMYFPQSQVSVIDTAIVISEHDTTRHLYSFNASAKMSTDLMQKFEGGLWVDTWRSTYTYDANNNILSFLEESCESDYEYQETYTYDANNNILTHLFEYRNKTQYSARYTYTYDVKNNILSYLYEEGIIGQLDNKYRYMYTYDTNNNVLSYLQEYWEDGQWLLSYRCTNIYDVNNKIFSLSEIWKDGKWVYDYKVTCTYDENNNMLSYLDERWYNNQWVYYYRETYTHNEDNYMLSELSEDWENGQWVFHVQYTYSYDINNHILTHSIESWVNGQWLYENRDTYTYDENSNILHALHEDWDNGLFNYGYSETYTYDAYNNMLSLLGRLTENGEWVDEFRVTYTYDTNSNLISVWYHRWSDSSWIPMNGWDGPGGGFCIDDIGGNKYCYSRWYNITFIRKLIVTDVESKKSEIPKNYTLSQNYPNPFNPSSTIKYAIPERSNVTLKVFDVLGSEVASLVNKVQPPGNYQVEFEGSKLTSGIYFYRLQAGEFLETRKMILLK